MRQMLLPLVACGLTVSAVVLSSQGPINRVYIEERVKRTSNTNLHCDASGNCYGQNTTTTRNVSLDVTRELTRNCSAVKVTDKREVADYVLRISPGSSTLYLKNGDVAYISPARFRVSNLVKDVCRYVESHLRGQGET